MSVVRVPWDPVNVPRQNDSIHVFVISPPSLPPYVPPFLPPSLFHLVNTLGFRELSLPLPSEEGEGGREDYLPVALGLCKLDAFPLAVDTGSLEEASKGASEEGMEGEEGTEGGLKFRGIECSLWGGRGRREGGREGRKSATSVIHFFKWR